MSIKQIVLFSIPALFLFNFSANAQEDELDPEVVNIVKPYTPTISDAFKVKETPVLNDSIFTRKKKVEYSIFSVPVASTFTPAKGKATSVEKAKPVKLYNNYATLGFGNYTSLLGELYSSFDISRTDNAAIFFRHNSSQGDIKDVSLDNKYYDTSLEASYTSRQRDMFYQLEGGVKHQFFNWYGVNNSVYTQDPTVAIDPQQNYISGFLGGNISFEDTFFESGAVKIQYLTDSFSSSEFNAVLTPKFTFPMEDLALSVLADINYLTGSFDRNYTNTSGINYSFLNTGVAPSLAYTNDDLSFEIGAAAYVSLDTENSETNFSLYPKLNASYRISDETVIIYGGVVGGLNQNTYYNFKEENPFVSPTLTIAPTRQLYNAFAGLKGRLSNSVGYDFNVSYGKDENRALFQTNPIKYLNPNLEGYEYGNSFNVVYDDVNTLGVYGELKVAVTNNFNLGVNANYYNYNTEFGNEAWNLPNLQASVFSNFNITEKFSGSATVFFTGERKDLNYTYDLLGYPLEEAVTLDAFVDANLQLNYQFTDRLSVFVKGNNLTGKNFEKWLHYPVQGIQGLAGATYKFNW